MSERAETGAAGAQAAAGAQPQEGAKPTGQEPAAAQGQEPAAGAAGAAEESPEERADRLERELKETRAEAARNRRKAQDLETAQAKAAEAGMSELERAQAAQRAAEERATALEAQVRTQGIRSAALTAATKLGFRNPEVAYRLLDRDELEFTDEGEPKNVEALLRKLATSESYLVKGAAAGDYGGGNRGGQQEPAQPGMNELIKAAIRGG